jgi:hypothetical protein
MTVRQVYIEYQTPENLQTHMLRVAALSEIITENWTGINIDKEAIITACAIHDIAKPVAFDIAKQAQYGMPEKEIENLKQLQIRIKAKYGSDEHRATVGIAKDIGGSPEMVRLLDNVEWSYAPKLISENDLNSLIPIYCDMRIGPKGIMSLKDRINDLSKRTEGKDAENNMKYGEAAETEIRKYVSIDLNSVTDEQLNRKFEELQKLEI